MSSVDVAAKGKKQRESNSNIDSRKGIKEGILSDVWQNGSKVGGSRVLVCWTRF